MGSIVLLFGLRYVIGPKGPPKNICLYRTGDGALFFSAGNMSAFFAPHCMCQLLSLPLCSLFAYCRLLIVATVGGSFGP